MGNRLAAIALNRSWFGRGDSPKRCHQRSHLLETSSHIPWKELISELISYGLSTEVGNALDLFWGLSPTSYSPLTIASLTIASLTISVMILKKGIGF
jgi:hypothetical protein